jgi:hypothetical protein
MPDIEVTATGNVQGGITALKQVQAELAKVAGAAAKTDSALDHAGKTLNTGLKNGANQATSAMTNLGRVIQDAPFGIIGITNNINPLLESFQRLKTETGSGIICIGFISYWRRGFGVSGEYCYLTNDCLCVKPAGGN